MARFAVFFLVLIFLSSPLFAGADSLSSTSFIIESGVIDAGGTRTTSTDYGLRSSLGEPATGISSSSHFRLLGGFLNFPQAAVQAPAPSPSPAPSPTPSPVSVAGGGGTGFIYPPALRPGAVISPEILRKIDFDNDGRINIVDLSIILFYYGKSGAEIARYDLNHDGIVDITDISILMFYWNG